VPQDPDVEAEAQVTDAEYQKDTKISRDINKRYCYNLILWKN